MHMLLEKIMLEYYVERDLTQSVVLGMMITRMEYGTLSLEIHMFVGKIMLEELLD